MGEFSRIFGKTPGEEPLPEKTAPRKAASEESISDWLSRPIETEKPKPASSGPLDDTLEGFGLENRAPDPPPKQPPAAEPPWQSKNDSGEFTRFFGAGLRGDDIDIEQEQALQAATPEPDTRPFQSAGEFTRMFGADPAKARTPTPPPPPRAQANASSLDIFAQQSQEVSSESSVRPPGEYTKLFGPQSPGAATPQPEPAPKPAPPPPVAKQSRWRPYVVMGVVAVVLIGLLVALLVLKNR
jgi:hypothetical protein